MTSTETNPAAQFSKGDQIVQVCVYNDGRFNSNCPELDGKISVRILRGATVASLGKKQGHALTTEDTPAKFRVFPTDKSIFRASDEAEAIAYARRKLGERIQETLAFMQEHRTPSNSEAHQAEEDFFANAVATRAWETCPVVERTFANPYGWDE